METKTCSGCKTRKEICFFSKRTKSLDKLQGYCKSCTAISAQKCKKRPNRRYKELVYSAKRRNILMELNFDLFSSIILSPCTFCNEDTYGITQGHGIDRLDSLKGYTPENSISCCWICNNIKATHDVNYLMNHLKKMIINLERLI